MASLKLKNIVKKYSNGYIAVKDFNLDINDKEFIIFTGPSGCGKTTALKMIAGLENVSEGEVYIEDKLINNIPSRKRDIAMVFQNYALYPEMNIYDNIAFGLKLKKLPFDEIDNRVKEAAEILNIQDILNKMPKELSKIEKQKIVMGRAIVRNPEIFLMDDPLSNLGGDLRIQMREEISKLHEKLQKTFVYVTHDQAEAMKLGTRIVVLRNGIIQQIDTPDNLYKNPINMFVAGFIGSPQMNFINVKLKRENDNILALFGDNKKIKFSEDKEKILLNNNIQEDVVMGIRTEDVHFNDDVSKQAENNFIESEVDSVEISGSELNVNMTLSGQKFIFKTNSKNNIKAGDIAKVFINPSKIHLFNKSTGHAIFN